MKEIRYGILSTSSIAPRFIAAVREANAGKIVALSSRDEDKAREKAALWQIPKAYGSHGDLLADTEIDTVYISTVNALHYSLAKEALSAGKNVVLEKPSTTSAKETSELFSLAKERGLFLMEAQKMLFLPTLLAVKKEIENGRIGSVSSVQMTHSFSASYNGWLFDEKAGGGTLLSAGIYAVELLLWLFGEISHISCEKSCFENGAEWQYILTGKTEGGVLFSALNSTKATLPNSAVIYGDKGKIEIFDYWKARRAAVHSKDRCEMLDFPCEHELIYEAMHVRDCIRQGLLTSPVVTPQLSVRGIEILEKLKKGERL